MVIDVLGLGNSLNEYEPNRNISIGVNDINKHFPDTPVDYLVCVDLPGAFKNERLRTIINSRSKKFFAPFDCWKPLIRECEIIKLASGSGNLKDLNSEKVCYSNNSTFVAVVLAYKLGAKRINLYGADFNTHPAFIDSQLKKTLNDFKNLYHALLENGTQIYVPKESKLSEFIPAI